jgi:hypothetical protein
MAALFGAGCCFRSDFLALFSVASGFELDFELASVSGWIAPDRYDFDRCDFGPILEDDPRRDPHRGRAETGIPSPQTLCACAFCQSDLLPSPRNAGSCTKSRIPVGLALGAALILN